MSKETKAIKVVRTFIVTGLIIIPILLSINTNHTTVANSDTEVNYLLNEEISLEEVHNILPVFEDLVVSEDKNQIKVETFSANITPVAETAPVVEEIAETIITEPVVETTQNPVSYGPSFDKIDYYSENFYQLANDYPDWYWMSKIIMAESEGESEEGQIAVGNVILNRVNSPNFDNTIKDVIHASGQFSVFSNGRINLYPTKKCITSAYKVLYENAKAEGMFDKVLYFRSDRASWWRGVTYWKTIGNHHFAYAK